MTNGFQCLLFRGFIEVCPSGALDKDGIMAMYLMPRDKAKVFINEMFYMFDADGNGIVSFKVSYWYALNFSQTRMEGPMKPNVVWLRQWILRDV